MNEDLEYFSGKSQVRFPRWVFCDGIFTAISQKILYLLLTNRQCWILWFTVGGIYNILPGEVMWQNEVNTHLLLE